MRRQSHPWISAAATAATSEQLAGSSESFSRPTSGQTYRGTVQRPFAFHELSCWQSHVKMRSKKFISQSRRAERAGGRVDYVTCLFSSTRSMELRTVLLFCPRKYLEFRFFSLWDWWRFMVPRGGSYGMWKEFRINFQFILLKKYRVSYVYIIFDVRGSTENARWSWKIGQGFTRK